MTLSYLIGGGFLLLVVGILLGRIGRKSGAADPGEIDRLRRQVRDVARELNTARDDLARRNHLLAQIPSLVRRLSENLPPRAIPAIMVRFLKEFYRPSRVGFFAPVEDGTSLTLVEGVGFPPEWKGSVRLPADRGMMGMAIQQVAVLSREEYLALQRTAEVSSSNLERIVGVADLVAPVPAASGNLGVIVLDGIPEGHPEERHYASMLADLLGSALQKASAMLSVETEASVDPLTGLANRRHFAEWFETEIRQARNYIQPLSLILFDIDHFKAVNDTHGHPAGDLVLKTVAETVRKTTRSCNLVARYGGEEFAVVMVSAGKEQATRYAEGIRTHIASLPVRIPGRTEPLRITLSGGIATCPDDGDSTTDLIRAADDALYLAKQEGRNRVCAARQLGLDGKPI